MAKQITKAEKKQRISVESSFDPRTGKYKINSTSRGTMPKKRTYDSHGELIAAVEKANPGYEVN